MGKEKMADIEGQISRLLQKKGKDYLTVAQIVKDLPAASLKQCGLSKKSTQAVALDRLKLYLGNSLQDYKRARFIYIGFKMPLEEIIEGQISRLLQKKGKDYLRVAQIVKDLLSDSLKQCGLSKKSTQAVALDRLKPYLGSSLQDYKGSISIYIGFKMPLEEIIIKRIKQNPDISSRKLGSNLPMMKKTYIDLLNQLLKSGSIVCTLKEDHTPVLRISDIMQRPEPLKEKPVDERAAFKEAYDRVGKGRSFVRIHRVREHLNWPREKFDSLLAELRADYTIELHGGDPSIMTEKEIQGSFMDENGILYLTMTWWGHR